MSIGVLWYHFDVNEPTEYPFFHDDQSNLEFISYKETSFCDCSRHILASSWSVPGSGKDKEERFRQEQARICLERIYMSIRFQTFLVNFKKRFYSNLGFGTSNLGCVNQILENMNFKNLIIQIGSKYIFRTCYDIERTLFTWRNSF